jgi:lysophospholipase L1-like esterase
MLMVEDCSARLHFGDRHKMHTSRSINLVSFFCLCFIFVLSGCGGGGGGGGGGGVTPPDNLPPLVDAGQDQFTYTSDQVTLTGVSSDDDGTIVSHQWTQTVGPQVDFLGATLSTLVFTPLVESAMYTFQYTATDDDGAQQSDTVSVYASKILFSDSFDDSSSLSNWVIENETVFTPDWLVDTEELLQNNSEQVLSFVDSYHLGTFARLNSSDFSGGDAYRFSVDIIPRLNSSSREGNDVGIMFGYTDTTHYYRLSMNARYGFTRLEKRQGATFGTLAVNSIGYIDDLLITVTVEVNGDTIMVFIDDEPVFAESNLTDLTGTIALYCQDKASFDNVVIAENSLQPMVAVSSPLAHSIALTPMDGNTLSVSAVAFNPPTGSSVVFTLDDGIEIASTVSGRLHSTAFSSVATGEHKVAAILKDTGDEELHRDTNSVVGVGGDYIIAVGDSITDGVGDENPDNNSSADGRTVAIQGFEAPLNDELALAGWPPRIIFNEGIPGVLAAGLEDTMITSILERHPRANAMLLLIGTNDAPAGGPGTPAGDFQASVESIVTDALTDVDRAYIARIPPRYDGGSLSFDAKIREYNDRIDLMVADNNDNVFPGPNLYTVFLGKYDIPDSLYRDDIHPNDDGYQAMAEAWAATLESTP